MASAVGERRFTRNTASAQWQRPATCWGEMVKEWMGMGEGEGGGRLLKLPGQGVAGGALVIAPAAHPRPVWPALPCLAWPGYNHGRRLFVAAAARLHLRRACLPRFGSALTAVGLFFSLTPIVTPSTFPLPPPTMNNSTRPSPTPPAASARPKNSASSITSLHAASSSQQAAAMPSSSKSARGSTPASSRPAVKPSDGDQPTRPSSKDSL